MKPFKILLSLVLMAMASLVVGSVFAVPVSTSLGTDFSDTTKCISLIVYGGSILKYYSPQSIGIFSMAVSVEMWAKYIIDNIFKENAFVNFCYNADDYVLNGSVVHIPQAGSKPNTTKNRATFPAPIVLRTDSDVTYALDIYRTDPTLILNAELMEISYDKMGSVLGEHVLTLGDLLADDQLIKWLGSLPAANILRTTGAAVTGHAGGATGNRKLFLKEDLKKAQYKMNKQGVSKTDRYALIDSDMFDQLSDDADLKKRDYALELDMVNGKINKLYGFQLIERSTSGIFNNAGTPVVKALDAATATTDNGAVVCWQKNALEKALGDVKFFETKDSAENYGDIYSAEVKFGTRRRRANSEGIIAIVQDASA